jgi:DNA polymerase elongation subunit (family B)
MRSLIIDISTAPIDGVESYIEEPSAPSNYKDEAKIAAYVLQRKAELCAKAALEPDLGRITGIGLTNGTAAPMFYLCHDEAEETKALRELALIVGDRDTLIGFNSMRFDWPMLVRRARYLGVELDIDISRYRSPHIDLLDKLTNHGQLTSRSLGFYVKRLGWTDLVKPLTGEEEAIVPLTGRWDELADSLRHDVEAIRRLANWLGVLDSQPSLVAASDARRGTP